MLIQLNIKQFGIIDNISIDFKDGLTVLSGETGAGKSMIFSALSQLSGQRTSTTYIRHGEDKATIEGIFERYNNNDLLKILEDLEIEDDIIILKRDIFKNGKSICKINNITVTLATLKKVSSYLIDIHEQRDNQIILLEKNHLSFLDAYAQNSINYIKDKYKKKYKEFKSVCEKIESFKQDENDRLQKLDFLKYQYKEINDLSLQKDETIKLKEELDVLLNYEKINSIVVETSHELLSDNGILNSLYTVKENVNKLSNYNSKFNDIYEEINNLYYCLEELQYDLSSFSNNIEYDENMLENIDNRFSKIKQIEKKYSKDANELIDYAKELEEKILELENYDYNYNEIKNKKIFLEKELLILAEELTVSRKKIAIKLEKLIQEELKFLYMEKSVIKIQIEDKDFSLNGKDDVKIMISSNLGEPLKALSKVASGGELSRIMLALKIIFFSSIKNITIIFDEIDTGISGRITQRMAEKMYELSLKSQILCISHLPQTTSLADQNLLIEKSIINNRTVSNVFELNKEKRVLEIARMISGNTTTQLSIDHSIELINMSNKIKEKIKLSRRI